MRPGTLLLFSAALAAVVGARAQNVSKTLITNRAALPASRPPMWPGMRQGPANATSVRCDKLGNGLRLTVVHQPLPNITADMMRWMWANLWNGTGLGADNGTWPFFLLLHPLDHASFSVDNAPVAPRSKPNFVEFPLTGCNTSDSRNWTCPAPPGANPGWTIASDPGAWALVDQTNTTTSVVRSLSNGGMRVASVGCSSENPNLCADVVVTSNTWSWTGSRTKTLRVTTTLRVGISMAANDIRIVNGWANGLDPMTKCWRMAHHYIQEISTVPFWLPAAYAAAGLPKKG